MKNLKFILTMVFVAGAAVLYLESCKKESAPNPLNLVSLTTDAGLALDGATPATGIPLKATFTATFDKAIDAGSATSGVALQIGTTVVASTVAVDGAAIKITPSVDLATGTEYTIVLGTTIRAVDGGPFTTGGSFLFKSFGRANVTAPQSASQLSYFPFTGNMKDVVTGSTHTPGASDNVKDITFVEDRFGFAGMAANFNGTTSIAEIPGGSDYMVGPDFSISFWVKPDGTKESHFVLGLAAWYGFQFEIMGGPWTALDKGVKLATRYDIGGGLTDAEDTWWNGQPNTWQGSTFAKDVSTSGGIASYFKDKWVHVVCTYQASTKIGSMYVNGEKTRSFDFDLWPAGGKQNAVGVKFAGNLTGGGNKLALGFIQASGNRIVLDTWADPADPLNNHFKGLMDDVRIWKAALTAGEVTTLYNAEKP
jgi:hypothetical protein